MNKKSLLMRALKGRAEVYTLISRYKEAIKDFEHIGRIGVNENALIDSFAGLSNVYKKLGAIEKSIYFADKAIKLCRIDKYSRAIGKSFAEKAFSLIMKGDLEESLELTRKSIDILTKVYKENIFEDKKKIMKDIASGWNNIGIIFWRQNKYKKALEAYQKSEKILDKIKDQWGISVNLNNKGLIYWHQNKYEKALKTYQNSLNIKQVIGDKRGVGYTLNNLGNVYDDMGEYQKSLKIYKRALNLFKEIGDKDGIAMSLNNIGVVFWNLGEYNKSINVYQKALKIFREINDEEGIVMAMNNIAQNLGKQDKKESLKIIKEAEKLAKKYNIINILLDILITKSNILLSFGNIADALEECNKALKLANRFKSKYHIVLCHSLLSNISIERYNSGEISTIKELKNRLENAFSIANEINNKEACIEVLKSLVRYSLAVKDYKSAKQYCTKLSKEAKKIQLIRVFPEIQSLCLKIMKTQKP